MNRTTGTRMSSLDRVLTTLGQREPDRVPLFLLPTMHGARELRIPLPEYFSRAENVVEGQLRMQTRYRNDCLSGFFYGPIETEAWGAEVIFVDDGPPNSGEPLVGRAEEVLSLEAPEIAEAPCLQKVLKAIGLLKERSTGIPIIGVVMSPFSLPVMQLGFAKYLDVMYERPDLFERLMAINEEFAVAWANAQLQAGATAIVYFDPVASPTVVPPDVYRRTGMLVAQRTLARIQGPTATHLASGRSLEIMGDLAATGTLIVGVSAEEDLAELKRASGGRLTLIGNLNGIQMRHWDRKQTEVEVKSAIAKGGPGGGFILSDNHGEIPWQVPEETLETIADAVSRWGRYPLEWVNEHAS
jgi:uroporphyrinogen decarboxylase